MKDKISKLKNVYKKYGLLGFIQKINSYFLSLVGSKISTISTMLQKKKIEKQLEDIFSLDYQRIIVWRSNFGYHVPLFQRPQHIASKMSQLSCLVFYEVTNMTDHVKTIHKEQDLFYLVNFQNPYFSKLLMDKIQKSTKPKYIQFYSTDWSLPLSYVQKQIENGFQIIYEYIDEIHPDVTGTRQLPKNVISKHEYALKDDKNVYIVTTADLLYQDVLKKRGKEKLIFATNGVDYAHYQTFDTPIVLEPEYQKVLTNGKINLCYYGAFAKWFDYELIHKIDLLDRYNIILFGVKYDESFDQSGIIQLKNVHFYGPKEYSILKYYVKDMDIFMIPFLINDITASTSPLKLFEYMALHKPIVTTNMKECRKYKSVLIGHNHKEFIEKLKEANALKYDATYLKLLEKEANQNDWLEKAKTIVENIQKGE